MTTKLPLRGRVALLTQLMQYGQQFSTALATPLLPEHYRALFDPVQPGIGRIVAVRNETKSARTLRIQTHQAWQSHLPGQYVRVGVDIAGVRHWRPYSVTSAVADTADAGLGEPLASNCFEVTVKAMPDGLVSNYLVNTATPGDLLHVEPAEGDFVLTRPTPQKALFLTAGSGITPVMGILRSHYAALRDVTLVHCAPSPAEVIFAEELATLAQTARVRVVQRFTDFQGLLTTAALVDLVPDWADRETWACGPIGFLDQIEAYWESEVNSDKLHTERFRTLLPHVGSGGDVTFGPHGPTVSSDGIEPLLTIGERQGVTMPSGCRMGICFGCVVPLVAGSVRDLRSGQITSAAPGERVSIQTCVSGAAGHCEVVV